MGRTHTYDFEPNLSVCVCDETWWCKVNVVYVGSPPGLHMVLNIDDSSDCAVVTRVVHGNQH